MLPFLLHISKPLRPKLILRLYSLVHSSCVVTFAFSVSSSDVFMCILLICKHLKSFRKQMKYNTQTHKSVIPPRDQNQKALNGRTEMRIFYSIILPRWGVG